MSSRRSRKRRQRDLDRVQAKKQVLPKTSGGDFLVQIGVGRGNDPHIRMQRSRGTDPLEFAGLDHAQQFGLLTHRHIRDLIEEKRALVGQLEASGAIGLRIGESAL